MSEGDIFVVSAPSGAGKTTLIRRLTDEIRGLHFTVSHTTRSPRPGEAEGIDYHFVSRDTFEEMMSRGGFLETAEVHGNLYGTSTAEVDDALARGEDVLLDIDSQGARNVRKARSGAILIFILPPSVQALRDRLKHRGSDEPAELQRRLEAAGREVATIDEYDYCITNDSLDRALKDLQTIIRARRLLRRRMPEEAREIVKAFDTTGVAPGNERRSG